MTLQQINQERSASISTIIAASEKSEDEKSPQVPDPSEGTYQPADDPDDDKQKEAEEAPPMPQPPTPP
ncbi:MULTISPECIES: hypothetical protein [unclassified Methylophaga]|jgi:hypothetical protein|uniref:hypothetical protein n=1 Tax=unclassified Methylophaga TaxID=2629249 RepID=UPI000C97651E|nr:MULTISPECIES: hypothetical protein [unclassified Methylophaga]MAK65957.1 hypothetical protein [Methylophaga sp.]MAY18666.1 hypothetical protein [Methylophaga sp.]HCD06626.1 hypothetical protein [Methylophaga sp.]|tara:strand:+ start:47955 stop:48158 length:204 start_codon:yes stop_codon:yes gene_type:complete